MSVTFCNLDDELKIIIMLHENGKNQHVEICKSRYNRVDFSHFHRLEKQSGVPELAEAKLRVGNETIGSSCMPHNIVAFKIRKNMSSGSRRTK